MTAPREPSTGQKALFKECRRLRKAGRAEDAVARLITALRRGELDADGVLHAGRLILEHRQPLGDPRVLILGQCTTSWLVPAIAAVAFGRGAAISVEEADYDNVLQTLATLDDAPQTIVLAPWHQRLFGDEDRAPADRIQDELDFWRQAWDLVRTRLDARLVQVGYDWVSPGPMGHHLGTVGDGDVHLVRQVNHALREHLPPGAYFVDLEQVSGMMGRRRFYDRRQYFWTRQPFSEQGSVLLAEHLWAGIRATHTGPKKVLVLDLDNTLWGGVVGETGPLGLELGGSPAGDAYLDFQRYLKGLRRRGCLLAACSKNNPDDAREPFEKNPEMVLSLEDFAAFEAGWEPKATVIERIATTLSLGLDTFVYFDDEPAEREQVRQALPEVEVVEVPDDPSEYSRALQAGLWFEAAQVTDADRARTTQYHDEQRRRVSQSSHASIENYLGSLEMQAHVHPIGDADFDRVVQLIGKTNQFNLTTRRHGPDAVRAMLSSAQSVGLAMRMRDRFGDYGLVAVLLGVDQPGADRKTLRIDTWLMSCRVIGRTAEQFLFNDLVKRGRDLGYTRLVGEYVASKKNAPVREHYPGLGFERRDDSDSDVVVYELDLEAVSTAVTSVQPASAQR